MARQCIEPGPGQESVWDYPRPPRLEDSGRRIKVVFGGVTLACTTRAWRVRYDVVTDERSETRADWYYPDPVPAYRDLEDVAFYPSKMDACRVDGEKVEAQDGVG